MADERAAGQSPSENAIGEIAHAALTACVRYSLLPSFRLAAYGQHPRRRLISPPGPAQEQDRSMIGPHRVHRATTS
jgi:hypothetical protein